ncbi:helix-turn-helix transcriptional regulator [Novosphingobium sp.]|uniref:helix-turn-helix transcriptional regulator n=1 Tax=Novosphingobium sp. TaxID=1874826 RepID=UPI003D0EDAB1
MMDHEQDEHGEYTEHAGQQRRELGAFVRARRENLSPDTPGTRRRTPGLRREELAARAGIGATWVTWIEQGRAVRPSAATFARLADALGLGQAERAYLFALAARHDPADLSMRAGADAPPAIAAIVAALPHPAYAIDPAWDVIVANTAAQHLFVGLFDHRNPGVPNLLHYVFTDPAARALLPDHEARCARAMAEFRRDYGRGMHDPRVRSVVEALQGNSPLFARLWAQQGVLGREGGPRRFDHPQDGALFFMQHVLADVDRGDFRLIALIPAQ